MSKQTKKPHKDEGEKPWNHNNNPIWLASSVQLLRNIDRYKFPSKASSDERKQVLSLVNKEIKDLPGLINPTLRKMDALNPNEKEFLAEHFLKMKGFQHSGTGEALLTDDSGSFITMINMENHLQMALFDTDQDLQSTWNRLVTIEVALGKAIPFSFSPRFGFLTASGNTCGTGLVVTIYLQPSALIHTGLIDQALEKHAEDLFLITGLHGDPNEVIGDLILFRNRHTLGVTEEDIISTLETTATKVLVEEKSLRSKIKEESHPELMDRVSRAYAILMHSYQIEAIEALNALGLLKLGQDLGWVEGVTLEELNMLFFSCRRSHLMQELHLSEISSEDLLHKRAEFIHEVLKKVKLTI